jgi:hypothetical protein
MGKDHRAVLDRVREATNPEVGRPPWVARMNITGDRTLRQTLGDERIDECLADLQRTDTQAGRQLLAVEYDGIEWLVLCEERRLRAAARQVGESENVDADVLGELNTALAEVREG